MYNNIPSAIRDTLPSLMHAVKVFHTIACYYNTTVRMSTPFAKITNQMITNCKEFSIIQKMDDRPFFIVAYYSLRKVKVKEYTHTHTYRM